jgi:hypothetical protein
VLAFALGPYLALGLTAWWQSRRKIASRVLFTVAVVLALGGLSFFGLDSYQYHTVPHHRMVQRMTVLVVPLVQWVVVIVAALALAVSRAARWSRRI